MLQTEFVIPKTYCGKAKTSFAKNEGFKLPISHHFLIVSLLSCISTACIFGRAGTAHKIASVPEKPRLIVLLIVDQMRADFLDRFSNAFKKNSSSSNPEGLQYFYERGAAFTNARTASAPTVTAAGHATVCSGATASKHGIIANSYFDRSKRELQETAVDTATRLIRTPGLLPKDPLSQVDRSGSSDSRLLTSNLADSLHLWSGGQSKTVSISVKDRGSVYCGGKNSAGVYWYDYQSGSMVTSSRYAQILPEWVNQFNKEKAPNFNFVWKPNFSRDVFKSLLGDPVYKRALDVRSALTQKFGQGFPYEYSSAEVGALGARKFFEYTPFASDYLVDFALEAQQKERLGCAQKRNDGECSSPQFADLLTLSFSTPDLVGHGFGPESLEHFDIYLNLNKSVERLRKELESRLGTGSILFIQTSDHGVQTLPEVARSQKGKPAGRLATRDLKERFEATLSQKFGAGRWVNEVVNAQVYFNDDTLKSFSVTPDAAVSALKSEVRNIEGVRDILSASDVTKGGTPEIELYKRGQNPARSGDAFLLVTEGWLFEEGVAGNHGTSHDEDTRIPVIFSGWRIQSQRIDAAVRADDVAPTILSLVGAGKPTFMTGNSLETFMSGPGRNPSETPK